MKKEISFILNGEERFFDVPINKTLADVLRYDVGIKSLKCGCERGDCGSCTLMIDGKTVRSCLVLAVEVDGHEVTTLEGIMGTDDLTPLQLKLHQLNSFQCGFCAPGMIMSLTALFNKNPTPNEEEIKEAIGGNLCRCTGYEPIIKACMEVSLENQRKQK